MIQVGLVGVGFMGWIHYLAYRKSAGAKLTAISTRDPKRRSGDWTGIRGNFGPPGEQVDLSGVATYAEWRELLANSAIDLVDICLPPHLHKEVAIAALEAGKHVFIEKPLALHAQDCNAIMDAATRTKRQVFVGHVLPFLPEYVALREAIESKRYGRLLGVRLKRVISNPDWIPDFFDPNKVGGPLVDLHVHDAHLIRFLLGMPKAVVSRGRMRGDVVEYCETIFDFDDHRIVASAVSGVIGQQGRPFTHGFEVNLERATLIYDLALLNGAPAIVTPLTILDSEGNVSQPAMPAGDAMTQAFEAEIAEVTRCLALGASSPILDGALARDAVTLCSMQTDAVLAHHRRGR